MRGTGLLMMAAFAVSASAEERTLWDPWIDVQGLASVRAYTSDEERSRLDGGFGRLRFGGDGSEADQNVQIGELALVVDAGVNDYVGLRLHAQHQPEFDNAVDLAEALIYADIPVNARWELSFDGGAILPGLSRENRGVAWSNTYTITNSPGFTWIAEEVRPVGARVGATYLGDSFSVSGKGGLFYANDASGITVAFGGWALNDLKTPIFSEVRLPDNLSPGGRGVGAPYEELDDRFGYQFLAEVDIYAIGGISFLWWDNRGDITASGPDGVVWDTRFFGASGEFSLPCKISFLPSLLVGDTETPLLGSEFRTASALFARDFGLPGDLGSLRIALRGDWFDQDDIRANPPNSLTEDGLSGTVAARWSLGRFHEFLGEIVHVRSEREFAEAGLPSDREETLVQVEYRFVF